MKQSIGLIILQFFGIVLGLVSVFWIAGSLPPDVYAVVGVYSVISIFIMVFSSTGIETVAIRNVLFWSERGEGEKIKLIVSQAIIYRLVLSTIIVLPIMGYAVYISKYKFENHHLSLFIIMSVFSIAQALNDSIVLILKAFNKYLAAAFITYSVNVFGKLIALFLFFQYGFITYIYTLLILPLITIIPFFLIVKKWINLNGVFVRSNFLVAIKEAKSFRLSSYIGYSYGYLDQLLVSIFMSAEILGSFTLAKSLLSIAKNFIENIFDPLMQNLVRYKNNAVAMQIKLNKIIKVRDILLLIAFLLLPFTIIYIDRSLTLLNLDNYLYLNYFAILIYLSQIAYIGMKIKYNYITLFFQASHYLRLTAINAIVSLFFFIVVISINVKFVFSYILLTNLIMILFTHIIYKKNCQKYVYEICPPRR